MSIIWPGLDLIFKSYLARSTKGTARYAFAFRMYPPSRGFKRGTFSQLMMERISALWKGLHPKAETGGRVAMDTIELRATIFAIRAYIDYVREKRRPRRRLSPELKTRHLLDDETFDRLKSKSNRMILTLERHLKRANRALQKSITQSAFAESMRIWREHLLWMRLHIAYFKPLPPVVKGRRIQQQKILDELTQMVKRGIRQEGYQPPEEKELRPMMRLYVRSARRGYQGEYVASYVLKTKLFDSTNRHLSAFVLKRLKLKEL